MNKITDPEPFGRFSTAARATIDMLSTSEFRQQRTRSAGERRAAAPTQ